jgi:hypothetical protein
MTVPLKKRRYLAIWGDGCVNHKEDEADVKQNLPITFFHNLLGYAQPDREKISKLELMGDSVNLGCFSRHIIVRTK